MTMIVTCPQCDTKFKLPLEMIEPDGKRVRCAKCKHDWFQEPVAEEPVEKAETVEAPLTAEKADIIEKAPKELPSQGIDPLESVDDFGADEFDDIPNGVKPDNDEYPQATAKKAGLRSAFTRNKLVGYGAACGVLMVIILISIALRPLITANSLKANAYYALFGLKANIGGQDIILNDVNAKVENGVLKLSSSLMNMAEDTEIIPYIMVEQINAAGNVVKTTLIKPLSETIKSKSVQPLYAEYPAHEDAKSVRVKLTLIKPEEEAPGSAELTEEGTEDDGDNRIDNQTNEAETETKSSPE